MDAAGGSVPGLAGSSVGAMPEVRTDSQVGSTTVVPGVQAQVQAQTAAGIGSGSQVGVTNGMPASQEPVPHQPENSTWPAASPVEPSAPGVPASHESSPGFDTSLGGPTGPAVASKPTASAQHGDAGFAGSASPSVQASVGSPSRAHSQGDAMSPSNESSLDHNAGVTRSVQHGSQAPAYSRRDLPRQLTPRVLALRDSGGEGSGTPAKAPARSNRAPKQQLMPKKPPSSRRASMEVKMKVAQQTRSEKDQLERERRAVLQARAHEKRLIREAKEEEKRIAQEQLMAERAAEKERKQKQEAERREAARLAEIERIEALKRYPMEDAALIQRGESTPAPSAGAPLEHGSTSDDHEVLGAAIMAAEFCKSFGEGPQNLLKVGRNGLTALPTFKELYLELSCPGASLSTALVALQVNLVEYLLHLSKVMFANTLLNVDWPLDSTTWTEMLRLILMNHDEVRTKSQEAAIRGICEALQEKEYNDLTPLQRATILNTLCNMVLDCNEFRATLDSVEATMSEIQKKEDESRRTERQEMQRLRQIDRAERQRLQQANSNRAQMRIGPDGMPTPPPAEEPQVSLDDAAGQAVISILHNAYKGDDTESEVAATIKQYAEAAGERCAPDQKLFDKVNAVRGQYLGVDRGGSRYWNLRCNPAEVIVERDEACAIFSNTRDGVSQQQLSEYLKLPDMQPLPVPDLSGYQLMEAQLVQRINAVNAIAVYPSEQERIMNLQMRAMAEQKLFEIRAYMHTVSNPQKPDMTAEIKRRLELVAGDPPKLTFASHTAGAISQVLETSLPDKSVREGHLRRAFEERLDDLWACAGKCMQTDRISGIVSQYEALCAQAESAKQTRGVSGAVVKNAIEDVREELLNFEASLDWDNFYVDKDAYMAGRERWLEVTRSTEGIHGLRQCLLEFYAGLNEKQLQPWWKADAELWKEQLGSCNTAGLFRLLWNWLLRAFKRLPGEPIPVIIEEVVDLRTEKKKEEPKIDRLEKRRLEREARERKILEDAKRKEEAKLAKKKSKAEIREELKAAEEAQALVEEPAWSYEGLLPPWCNEGTLIWAKVWGFPWWPALINAPEDTPGKKRAPTKKGQVWVFNLGAANFSEVDPAKCISTYTAENTRKYGIQDKIKPNLKKDLKNAMRVAEGIIKAEGQNICGRGLDGPFGLPGGIEDPALQEGGKRPANGAPDASPAAKKKKKK